MVHPSEDLSACQRGGQRVLVPDGTDQLDTFNSMDRHARQENNGFPLVSHLLSVLCLWAIGNVLANVLIAVVFTNSRRFIRVPSAGCNLVVKVVVAES